MRCAFMVFKKLNINIYSLYSFVLILLFITIVIILYQQKCAYIIMSVVDTKIV